MVYISVKKILLTTDEQKVWDWKVLQYSENKDFIESILSRKNAVSRKNSIEAYSLLDEMLLALTNTKKAVLRRNENEKPYIENKNISFNLTHTDGAVACIIDTEDHRVGIDAEVIGRDGQKMIERFFDEKAKQEYALSDDRSLSFAKIWTKKEAYAKFTGIGLSDYSTDYPSTCKFTHLKDGDLFVTACTHFDANVQIWQERKD